VRKRPLGIPRRRWVCNIRMDLRGKASVSVLGGESGGKGPLVKHRRGSLGRGWFKVSCWGNRVDRDHWGDLGVDG